ncbi:MAG: SDR family NAD(P)-dependent oxidoreductase [Pseudooceanicola nanhaiensis]|uniref:SDR family NAD(P)-dependent oxidoreductase n=1 Tax=Rhodobacterales TaxID=204455 RepID=UPI004059CCE7
MLLKDKLAVITGGASGQGLATAGLFLDEGAKVVIVDWNAETGAKALEELGGAGRDISFLHCDLGQGDQVRATCDEILATHGAVDVLFNNAGIGYSEHGRFAMASIFDTPLEDWEAILRINLTGAFLMTKFLGPSMVDKGAGSIIFNASIAGIVGQPNIDAYTASKGGLVALTRALAGSLGADGIRVNAICPGAIDTPMIKPVLETSPIEDRLNVIPLRRIGTPRDIAGLALFLASEHSAYVTGQIIACDGGRAAI